MESPIGFFDSGLGGASVLKEAIALFPTENYVYYGDNGNAPYGERAPEDILSLTLASIETLKREGIKALVIACNTASSVMTAALRERVGLPVIGMEPALKPAQQLRHGGRVLVLATRATLALPKFAQLMARYGEGAKCVPFPELVVLVEKGLTAGDAVRDTLAKRLSPYLSEPVDAVVLGCTHFVFLKEEISRFFRGKTAILDGNAGTVAQMGRVLAERGLRTACGTGSVRFMTSGEPARFEPLFRELLNR